MYEFCTIPADLPDKWIKIRFLSLEQKSSLLIIVNWIKPHWSHMLSLRNHSRKKTQIFSLISLVTMSPISCVSARKIKAIKTTPQQEMSSSHACLIFSPWRRPRPSTREVTISRHGGVRFVSFTAETIEEDAGDAVKRNWAILEDEGVVRKFVKNKLEFSPFLMSK